MSVTSKAAPPVVRTATSLKAVPAAALRPSKRAKVALMVADVLAVVAAVLLAYALERTVWYRPFSTERHRHFVLIGMATLPGWVVVFANQRLYSTRFISRRIDEARRIVNASFLGVVLVALAGSFSGSLVPRSALLALGLLTIVLVMIEREVARRIFARVRAHGGMLRHVVIAGANPEGRELAAMLQAEPWLGYRVLGFVDDSSTDPQPVAGVPLLGTLADTAQIVRAHSGSSVIVAASAIESEVTNRLARDLLDQGIHLELSSTLRDISSQRLTVRPLGRFPVVYVEPVLRGGWRSAAKRTFDVVAATFGLLVTSPLIVVAMIAIRLDSRGSVVFHQTRVGRNSTPFQVLKLRTMVPGAEALLDVLLQQNEADGPLFKMRKDPRVTRVGAILRKTSIDELPQLWNVLRGEMSLVGPRPALPHETQEWDALLTQRLRVKPGITGMWQVNGRNETSFEDYTRLDLYYVDNWSLTTDLAILAKTVPVVLSRKGAS